MAAIAANYVCFLTYLYKFHGNLSLLHDIACSSGQLRLEGGIDGDEPSTLLSFCLYQIDITVVV